VKSNNGKEKWGGKESRKSRGRKKEEVKEGEVSRIAQKKGRRRR